MWTVGRCDRDRVAILGFYIVCWVTMAWINCFVLCFLFIFISFASSRSWNIISTYFSVWNDAHTPHMWYAECLIPQANDIRRDFSIKFATFFRRNVIQRQTIASNATQQRVRECDFFFVSFCKTTKHENQSYDADRTMDIFTGSRFCRCVAAIAFASVVATNNNNKKLNSLIPNLLLFVVVVVLRCAR